MKVLHCIPHMQAAGADIGTVGLVRSLNNFPDVEAKLCVFRGKEADSECMRDMVEPILLDFRGSHARPGEFLRFREAIRGVVKDWQPDVIHSHLWPACRWTSTALLGMRLKHVWHIHDTRAWLRCPSVRSRFLRSWTRNLATRIRPRVIAVSLAAATYNSGPLRMDPSDFLIASIGVNASKFAPRSAAKNEHPVIGLAAQFRPEKGHAVLLEAARRLYESGLRMEIRLAGDGPLLEESKTLTSELGLDDCVQFLGTVKDIPKFLSGLDLFVLPSTAFEGLPLCLLEAMSMKVPVVASDVAGTREIVRDGDTGRLVRPGDAGALADTIWRTLHDREGATKMAERARDLVLDKHTDETVARAVVHVYRAHALA